VTTGAPVEFAVVLSNTDVVPHSREVTLRVDGETVAAKRVTVDSGEERTIVLTHAFDSAGEQTFRIGAHRTTVSVGSEAMATTGTPTATASPTQESETATRSTDGATTGTTAVPTGVERGGELSSVRRVSGLSTTQLAGVGIAALLGGIVVVTLVLDRD
jgi:cobalamin biosynthesis Mg chelatase CobN